MNNTNFNSGQESLNKSGISFNRLSFYKQCFVILSFLTLQIATFAQSIVGFASVSGLGLNGTTGGEGGRVVTATNVTDLKTYMDSNEKLVIYISGTMDLGGDMTPLRSNKSLLGLGNNAKIINGGLELYKRSNIIIRNITFENAPDDAMKVNQVTHHLWVDHCTFTDGAVADPKGEDHDELFDITRESSFITISYCLFTNHAKTILIGHSDSYSADAGDLRVTLHHNWFNGTRSRHPRVRFGIVHVFNNYYTDNVEYGVASTCEADVVVEGNYFKNVPFPAYVGYAESPAGDLVARNNVFVSSGTPQTRGTAFNPQTYYAYTMDNASDIPSIVTANAGAGKITITAPATAVKSATASANYYVATNGSDSNPGTVSQPFLTINKAVSVAVAGDYIYVRGGTYAHPAIRLTKSGTSSAKYSIVAYQNEVPVLDFAKISSSDRGIRITGSYWYLKGLIVQHSPNHGITITGSNVTIEKCETRYNGDMGLNLTSGAGNCLILNCDSYYNFDPENSGENADGFAAKYSVGTGIVFRGCRSWHNSDDGWDLWEAGNSVRFENCWAFENGDNYTNISSFAGDGNGFKLGKGSGRHVLIRCVAWNNYLGNGFEDNANSSGVEFYNCTAYNNKAYGFETKSKVNHIVKNNISYLGKGVAFSSTSVVTNNSWQGLTVTNDDFASLDATIAKGARQSDGSLPVTNFLRLAASSDLIDKGVNVGLPYNGSAPDLGAFEYGTMTIQKSESEDAMVITEAITLPKEKLVFYPNPFTGAATIKFTLETSSKALIKLTNSTGTHVEIIANELFQKGENQLPYSNADLKPGVYILSIHTDTMDKQITIVVQ